MGSPSRFLMGFPLPLPDAYKGWWEAETGSNARPRAPRKVVGTEGWSIRSNIGMGEKASINFLAHS
jgi:hypothetical protein